MALLNMYGFNHGNQAVQSDGVSPVNGVGLQDSGYNITYGTNLSSAASGTAGNPTPTLPDYLAVGVVSDPDQAMGKAPKRQPLVVKQMGTASAPASGQLDRDAGIQLFPRTNPSPHFFLGFRMSWDYDGNVATITNGSAGSNVLHQTAGAIPIVLLTFTATAGTVGNAYPLVELLPLTQQVRVAGSTFSLPPGVEAYIEVDIINAATSTGQFNGNPTSTQTQTGANGFILSMGLTQSGRGFVTPTNSGAWGQISFCDIYITNAVGAAPWNGFLGPVKILNAVFDTSVSNSFDVSPTGITPVEAVSMAGDNDLLVTKDVAVDATFGISALPAGVDGQLLALQSFVTTSRDSGYVQTMSFTEKANGTSATAVDATMPGTDPVITAMPLRTTLPDGSALNGTTLLDYQLSIDSTP